MSRAYRIKVRESLRRVLRASDRVSTRLELLEVLPTDEMGRLLADELERRGYTRQGTSLVRQHNGITISVDPATGTVTVEVNSERKVKLEAEETGRAYEDVPGSAERTQADLGQRLRENLEQKACDRAAELQAQVTERLEAELGGLRLELDQAVNRVTAEALKRKAAQIGQIKEMTEDPQSGSLTIVLEV